MKILHTSDWHIGRKLNNKWRYDEMKEFLAWLIATIQEHEIDVLLLSGDVFDNSMPPLSAQKMYYDFLKQAWNMGCQVVVTSGNHDSAALLDAPSELCRELGIYVIGSVWRNNLHHEVILLPNLKSKNPKSPGLIVCAVPFLHAYDVRTDLGEIDTKDIQDALLNGIRAHYEAVIACARKKQQQIKAQENVTVPIVVMGHLFAKGGNLTDSEGVRDLYVGSLNPCELDMFPTDIAYTALGHIHVSQTVRKAGQDGYGMIRYSGSPIPMGFNEAKQQKSVCLIDFPNDLQPKIEFLPVPKFQRLELVRGDEDTIKARLNELALELQNQNPPQDKNVARGIWLGVTYTGTDSKLDIVEKVEGYIKDIQESQGQAGLELVVARNEAKMHEVETKFRGIDGAGLDSLTPEQVFERKLLEEGLGEPDFNALPDTDTSRFKEIQERRKYLLEKHAEVLAKVREDMPDN